MVPEGVKEEKPCHLKACWGSARPTELEKEDMSSEELQKKRNRAEDSLSREVFRKGIGHLSSQEKRGS